jgi:CRISPR-associated exonuclease Cas4
MDDRFVVMLSALQHYIFCPRQCALIHLEGVWSESYLTASGRTLHERVDRRVSESRRNVHQATALRLFSNRLGLTGVADMVEFQKVEIAVDEEGRTVAAELSGQKGFWKPFPVEYKRGKPKSHQADEVQLCAQALCLEEMLDVVIPRGALFYGETRRRVEVEFDSSLRELTETVAGNVRDMLQAGVTPPPVFSKACKSCSLLDDCRPDSFDNRRSASRWIRNRIEESAL